MRFRPAVHGLLATGHTQPAQSNWNGFDSSIANPLDADELFATLDGRSITTPQGAWFIEIQSIVDEAGLRWIQLTLTGNPLYSLTFQVNPGDDADEAVRALSLWLTSDGQRVM